MALNEVIIIVAALAILFSFIGCVTLACRCRARAPVLPFQHPPSPVIMGEWNIRTAQYLGNRRTVPNSTNKQFQLQSTKNRCFTNGFES